MAPRAGREHGVHLRPRTTGMPTLPVVQHHVDARVDESFVFSQCAKSPARAAYRLSVRSSLWSVRHGATLLLRPARYRSARNGRVWRPPICHPGAHRDKPFTTRRPLRARDSTVARDPPAATRRRHLVNRRSFSSAAARRRPDRAPITACGDDSSPPTGARTTGFVPMHRPTLTPLRSFARANGGANVPSETSRRKPRGNASDRHHLDAAREHHRWWHGIRDDKRSQSHSYLEHLPPRGPLLTLGARAAAGKKGTRMRRVVIGTALAGLLVLAAGTGCEDPVAGLTGVTAVSSSAAPRRTRTAARFRAPTSTIRR